MRRTLFKQKMIYTMIMNDNLTPDARIAELKAKGMKNKDIAPLVYPDLPIESAIVKVSRHLNKGQAAVYLEQSKLQALKEHNITWSRIIAPLNNALDAEKQNQFTGEITPDYNTQMRASKQLSELLQAKDMRSESEPAPMNTFPSDWTEIQIAKAWKNPPPKD